jgi:hypothetical protein
MSTRALFGVLLLMSFGWLFIYGAPIHNELTVLRAADGYRAADLLVTEARCITSESSDGPSDTWCYLEGTIDGQRAELRTGSSLPPEYPEGSRVQVLFNPAMPDVGWNHESLRVVRWEPDLAAGSRRRIVLMSAVVAASLLLTIAVHVALRQGIRRRSRGGAGGFSADLGGGTPHLGVPMTGMGLMLLLGQFTGGGVAIAGVILGLALTGGGAWLARRRYVATERHGHHITIGEHVLGHATRTERLDTGPRGAIRMHGEDAPWILSLVVDDDETEVARLRSLKTSRGVGAALAEAAGCAWRDEVTEKVKERAPSFFLPTTETGRIGLVLFVAVVAGGGWYGWHTWQKPATRERVALSLVEPRGTFLDFQSLPAVRAWAARELAELQTPAALLGVVRLLNTIDVERHPEVAAGGMEALRAIAGVEGPAGEWAEQLRRMNLWVAERVGRRVDAHGGVLGWYRVSAEFQEAIDAIAGPDPEDGWRAWSSLGAGTLTDLEQFLFAAGSALGDARPIAFTVRRTSAPGEPLEFDVQPEAPGGDVLARTVGEAVALRLWEYHGVDDPAVTGDFAAWWSGFAARRLLPPLPAPLKTAG